MSLLDTYNLLFAPPAELVSRITAQVYESALNIRNEDGATANHANRLAWADATLASADALRSAGQQATWHVFANATIRSNPAGTQDGDIAYSVVTDALPRLIAPEA